MPDAKQEKPKRRFHLQLPHVYTIAFMLIVFFAVLTWIVPSGQFDRQTIQTAAGEREVAVAGTYQEVDKVYTDSETGRPSICDRASMPSCRLPPRAFRLRPMSSRSSC